MNTDIADNSAEALAEVIAKMIHAIRRGGAPLKPGDAPRDEQAALFMITTVLPIEHPSYRSDRFYALAVDLADSLDRLCKWYAQREPEESECMSGMAECLRLWAEGIESEMNEE